MRRDRATGSHAPRGTRAARETRSRRRPEARGRGEARSSPRALEAAAAPTDARRNARATRERERAPESLNGANHPIGWTKSYRNAKAGRTKPKRESKPRGAPPGPPPPARGGREAARLGGAGPAPVSKYM